MLQLLRTARQKIDENLDEWKRLGGLVTQEPKKNWTIDNFVDNITGSDEDVSESWAPRHYLYRIRLSNLENLIYIME